MGGDRIGTRSVMTSVLVCLPLFSPNAGRTGREEGMKIQELWECQMGLDGGNTWEWIGDTVMRAFSREDTADKTLRACVGDDIASEVSCANNNGNANG